MALGDRIRQGSTFSFSNSATAIAAKVAKVAALEDEKTVKTAPTFATIAGFAVAEVENKKTDPKLDAPTPGRLTPKNGNRISPVALTWLRDHRQELRQVGWTMAELYRRNKSPGICWCKLWDAPFLKTYLHESGIIEFECVIAGRDCRQTARPMPQRQARREK